MTVQAIVSPLKRAIQSAIVGAVKNRLFTQTYVVKHNPNVVSLPHFRNELTYSGDYREWVLSDATSIVDGKLRLERTTLGAQARRLNTAFKPNTKYLFLLYYHEGNRSFQIANSAVFPINTTIAPASGGIGNRKNILTTLETLTGSEVVFKLDTTGYAVISDIRAFELPSGSEIESDANTKSADALMLKYNPSIIAPGELKAVVQGRTLKNEADYTLSTYEEWEIQQGDVIIDGTGLEFSLRDTSPLSSAYLATNLKPSTKYGLLLRILVNELVSGIVLQLGNDLTGSYATVAASGEIGYKKIAITTQATITNNRLRFIQSILGSPGLKVKVADIRLFELSNSEIESDFNAKSADELALKYPMSVGPDGKTGGVRSVGSEKATNVVANGDFRYGTTGYGSGGVGSINTMLDGIFSSTGVTDGSKQAFVTKTNAYPRVTGRKVYAVSKIKVLSSCYRFWFYANDNQSVATIFDPIPNYWHTVDGIVTFQSDGPDSFTNMMHEYSDTRVGKTLQVQYMMCFPISDIFGLGLEPDLDTCRRMFADYFEGSRSITRLRSVGKNLFDKSKLSFRSGYVINAEGLESISSISSYTLSFVTVKPNTSYVHQGLRMNPGSTVGRIYFYDRYKRFISITNAIGDNNPYVFTTPSNCYYLRFQGPTFIYNSLINFNSWQLEEGYVATAYESYRETVCLVPEELKQVDSVADSFDASAGVLTKQVSNAVVLDGNLNWIITNLTEVQVAYLTQAGFPFANVASFSFEGYSVFKGNATLQGIPTAQRDLNHLGCYYVTPTPTFGITFALGTFATVQEAKNYFASNPLTVIYQLANPITKQYNRLPLGSLDGLKLEKGGTLYVEKLGGSPVGVVPNLQIQYERSI